MIAKTAHQVTKRVTTEGVATKQHQIRQQNERANTHSKPAIKPERVPHVARQNDQKDQGKIKKIAVDILQDQRKGALAQVLLPWLAHCTGRGVGPECLVVRAAIIVTGHAKPARRPKNEYRCCYPRGHPARLGTKPTLIGSAKQFR